MTNRMSVYIDDDLHKKFKHLCVEEGISITKKVVNMIEKAIQKRERLYKETNPIEIDQETFLAWIKSKEKTNE